jgi:phenylpyruvate tautomerase PptA (4-oxalocrotonate tautomerase family)
MPMLDAYIPAGALSEEAEGLLLRRLTDLLLRHEGADPANQVARSIAWVFVHRPEVYVGGARAEEPHYRFICQVPEGQYDDERRAAVTVEMTRALVEAEGGRWPNPENRVWIFTHEIPDGTWGGRGRVARLPDIAAAVNGEPGRHAAMRRLSDRRRQAALALLEAAGWVPNKLETGQS